MITFSIDIEDRLINEQISIFSHNMCNHQQVLRIYVKFDDLKPGIKVSSLDNLGRSDRWVPIE